jgi:hypothetical protein
LLVAGGGVKGGGGKVGGLNSTIIDDDEDEDEDEDVFETTMFVVDCLTR